MKEGAPLTAPPDPHAAAPIASLTAFWSQFKFSSQAECSEQPGLLRYHTAVPHPWFSGVLVSRPPTGSETASIQEQVAYFRSRGVLAFTWWLEPGLSMEAWAERLLPHGFRLNHEPPGMVCALDELPASTRVPPGFSVHLVQDLPTLELWVRTFIDGYGLPTSFDQPFFDLLASLGLQGSLQHYLGYLDSAPAAAASIFYSDGIAGIYNVAVAESTRGQGLGAAITLAPLLEARARGCNLGALQSSEMGFSVYQRLGFRKVCDVRHFSISLQTKGTADAH